MTIIQKYGFIIIGMMLIFLGAIFNAEACNMKANYTYDAMDRLIKVEYEDCNGIPTKVVEYLYDAMGNRLAKTVGDAGAAPNDPPYAPSSPSPADLAQMAPYISTISWTGGDPNPADIVSYQVTMGTDSANMSVICSTTNSYCDFSPLTVPTTYYWQVTAMDNHGAETIGPLWSFEISPYDRSNMVRGVIGNMGSSWVLVDVPGYPYASMVVVCAPNYTSSDLPAVCRVRNAGANSFEIRLQNPGNASLPSDYSVHYMVVEEGVYDGFSDGIKMEAVKFTSTITDENNSWQGEQRSYLNSYINPVVFGQVMTANDSNWSVFWSRGATSKDPPDSNTLYVGKHVGEDTNVIRQDETIGYIVIEAGSGSFYNITYTAAVGPNTVQGIDNSPPFTYSISANSPFAAIISQAGMNGGQGSWPLLYGPTPVDNTTLELATDEDQIKDTERAHAAEEISYIVFE